MKALAKRPSERYRSAEEFSAALTEVRRQIDPSSTGQHTMVLGAVAGEAAAQTTLMAASSTPSQPTATTPLPASSGTAHRRPSRSATARPGRDRAHRGARHRRRGGRAADLARGGSSNVVTVPTDIPGQTVTAARAELTALGLKPTTKDVPSSVANKGLAVSTDPAGGQSVKKGSTVTINVGGGPKTTTVPNVVGPLPIRGHDGAAECRVLGARPDCAELQRADRQPSSPRARRAATQLAPQQSVTITVSSGATRAQRRRQVVVLGDTAAQVGRPRRRDGQQPVELERRQRRRDLPEPVGRDVLAGRLERRSGGQQRTGDRDGTERDRPHEFVRGGVTCGQPGSARSPRPPTARLPPPVSCSPRPRPAGTSLAQGATVRYTVSLGPRRPPRRPTPTTTTGTSTTPAPPPA